MSIHVTIFYNNVDETTMADILGLSHKLNKSTFSFKVRKGTGRG